MRLTSKCCHWTLEPPVLLLVQDSRVTRFLPIFGPQVYCAMNVPNLGPYARYWLRCSCTELMPCSSKEPQDTDQVYAAHIHDRNEAPSLTVADA